MVNTLIQVLIVGTLLIVALLVGGKFLWDKKYRPAQIRKGKAMPTFSNGLKRTTRFIFVEDNEKLKKLSPLNRKALYLIMFVLSFVMFIIGSPKTLVVGGIVLLSLGITIFGRARKIFAARHSILMRMYEVATSEFRYPRGTELNPWSVVQIKTWEALTVPGDTTVSFPAAFRSDDPRKRKEFESHFNDTLGENNMWVYTWDGAKGTVECTPVSHLPGFAEYEGSVGQPWYHIPMGVGAQGEIFWDLSIAPHMLICGTTGGGKSVAQQNIIFHCIQHPDKVAFLGIDLKRVELSPYKKYDDVVLGIATELEDAVEVLRFAFDEMNDRYVQLTEYEVNHFEKVPNPPKALIIMVDEAYELMSSSGGKSDNAKREDELHGEATDIIGRIARLGRAAGVHIILATQRPDAKVIYGEIKQNLATRYAAGRMDSIASNMVLDSDAATRTPGNPKGRAIMSVFGSEQVLQGYYAEKTWIDGWLDENKSDSIPDNSGMRITPPANLNDGMIDESFERVFPESSSLDEEDMRPALSAERKALNMDDDEDYESLFGESPPDLASDDSFRTKRPVIGQGLGGGRVREEDTWDEGMDRLFAHVDPSNVSKPEVEEQVKTRSLGFSSSSNDATDDYSSPLSNTVRKPAQTPPTPPHEPIEREYAPQVEEPRPVAQEAPRFVKPTMTTPASALNSRPPSSPVSTSVPSPSGLPKPAIPLPGARPSMPSPGKGMPIPVRPTPRGAGGEVLPPRPVKKQ